MCPKTEGNGITEDKYTSELRENEEGGDGTHGHFLSQLLKLEYALVLALSCVRATSRQVARRISALSLSHGILN
jgi:hypothetical protein